MTIKVFRPESDDIVDGDMFIAHVDTVEGHKVVTLEKI